MGARRSNRPTERAPNERLEVFPEERFMPLYRESRLGAKYPAGTLPGAIKPYSTWLNLAQYLPELKPFARVDLKTFNCSHLCTGSASLTIITVITDIYITGHE